MNTVPIKSILQTIHSWRRHNLLRQSVP